MADTAWFHVKAEQCARLARDAVDPVQRSRWEHECKMWLQISALETYQDERRDDKRRNAVAFALDPSRPRDPVKGLDLDNPEARRRFLDGEI
jgi:hypothetical protein